jgi:class 3 adenylate cyclase
VRQGLPLALRIGVNSGPAIVGDIGTPRRRDYTAFGATVNLAARLEHAVAGPGQIVIGPRTRELLGDAFACRPLEPRPLQGIAQPVGPWLVEGPGA